MARNPRPNPNWTMHDTRIGPAPKEGPKCDNRDGNEAIFTIDGKKLCGSCSPK